MPLVDKRERSCCATAQEARGIKCARNAALPNSREPDGLEKPPDAGRSSMQLMA